MKKFQLLSDYLNISSSELSEHNILNNFVDDDSGYYISLEDIKKASLKEFSNYESIYKQAIDSIQNDSIEDLKKGLFAEPKFVYLGHVIFGHKGKGIRFQALKVLKNKITNDYFDIDNFELLGQISPQLGVDALNDFLSNMFLESLFMFTENKCKELNLDGLNLFYYDNKKYLIKTYYDHNGKTFPVIFYPKNIMRKYLYILTSKDIYRLSYAHKLDVECEGMSFDDIKSKPLDYFVPFFLQKRKIYVDDKKEKTGKGNLRYNNIDAYNFIKKDLKNIDSLNNIQDDIFEVTNYFLDFSKEVVGKLVELDFKSSKHEKLICTDNYRQVLAYISNKMNELLLDNDYLTKFIITRNNIFIVKNSNYIQICVRTAYNISCINEVSYYKKVKEIQMKKRVGYKIIVCDPNDKFHNYVSQIKSSMKDHFIVIAKKYEKN